jgi:hypothetical protein
MLKKTKNKNSVNENSKKKEMQEAQKLLKAFKKKHHGSIKISDAY